MPTFTDRTDDRAVASSSYSHLLNNLDVDTGYYRDQDVHQHHRRHHHHHDHSVHHDDTHYNPHPYLNLDLDLELKIDFASKNLTQVIPLPTTRSSPWLQAGESTRVLSGLAKVDKNVFLRSPGWVVSPPNVVSVEQPRDVKVEAEEPPDWVNVYYQIFIGPDHTGTSR
jgi:hypothetical protein